MYIHQVVTSESGSQVRLLSLFPTLPDVNLDGVLAIFLEGNQHISRMQLSVAQAGHKLITFNESHIPVTEQMANTYKYLKQKFQEA